MRIVVLAFLASNLLIRCGIGATNSNTPAPGQSPAPPAVLQLADAYVNSVPDQKPSGGRDIRKDFLLGFFRGFTMPGATSGGGGPEAHRQGFLAGLKYRKANPAKIKETMEGFGYTATEAEGILTVSLEHSGFRPSNQATQNWWFSSLGDVQSDLPRGKKIPREGVRIRVTGYLSSSGHYGHLNNYDHEFFATSISKVGG